LLYYAGSRGGRSPLRPPRCLRPCVAVRKSLLPQLYVRLYAMPVVLGRPGRSRCLSWAWARFAESVGTSPVRSVSSGTGPVRYMNRSGSHPKPCLTFLTLSKPDGLTGLPVGFLNRGSRSPMVRGTLVMGAKAAKGQGPIAAEVHKTGPGWFFREKKNDLENR
jgi:hypothetical protein